LPLLISALLLAAIVVFAWAAYRRVQHILLAAAGPRLHSVAVAVDALMAQSVVAYDGLLVHAASDPAIVDYLRTGRERLAARRALGSVWTTQLHVQGRAELRRPDGTIVVDTAIGAFPPSSDWVTATIDSAALSAGSVRVGPLFAIGGSTYYEAVVAVGATGGSDASRLQASQNPILGYVSDVRLVSGQNAGLVRDLIGTHSAMLLGSPGSGVWSDLEHRVDAPPVDSHMAQAHMFRKADGTTGVGVAMPVPAAPWVLWVEQPSADILAPTHPLLTQLAILAGVVILAGAAAGWFLSRRITRPIVSITDAAERIAAGPGALQDRPNRDDEVARLDDAFRRMARRVDESLSTATGARAQAEAHAREAQALADELEQQFEEAQALSEELEQANERLQTSVADAHAARAEAESANKAKVEFLASMSHELRTPLNAIAGYVDLLEMEIAGPVLEKQRQYLARVKHAQGLLLRRIDDVLSFAKIDSGTLAYVLGRVPLDETLSGLAALVQPLMERRGLVLEYGSPDPDLAVRADREKCEQIVLNVLSNAMKFTGRGGRVTVTCAPSDDRIAISVSDTGVGIPPDKLAVIFEPFVQVDPSLTRQRDGTGLGLAISRQLARGMGGELTAVSSPGAGSTFTLTLPAAGVDRPDARIAVSADAAVLPQTVSGVEDGSAKDHPPAEQPTPAARVTCRILVVDDNHDAAEAQAALLALWGHEVKAVADGVEAVASAPVFAPDVVLLDIGLPGIDGYTVAARLREIPETRSSCLIALTGYGRLSDYERALDAGCDHHLTKPAHPEEILRLIDRWLAARQSTAHAGGSRHATMAGG